MKDSGDTEMIAGRIRALLSRFSYSSIVSTLILCTLLWIAIELHNLPSPFSMTEFKLDPRASLDKLPLVRVFDVVRTVDVEVTNTVDVDVTNAWEFGQ